MPPEPEQDTFIKDTCTQITDAYLAPIELRETTLTLVYSTISLPSWSAGSRQVSCSIGATLGNGGWSTLLNSAKGPLLINGQPPVPPPDIPAERFSALTRLDHNRALAQLSKNLPLCRSYHGRIPLAPTVSLKERVHRTLKTNRVQELTGF